MKTQDKLILGALAGAGLAWGAREWLRSKRRITLDNRVVIVTGASSGHGFLVAQHAASHGAWVVIAARDGQELHEATKELARLGARGVLAVPTDVTDPDQCRALVDRAITRYGRVDILVNNAGIIQVGPMETMTLEDYQQAMATNFWGALYCTFAVLPHMKAQRFGRICNVVSLGGKRAVPHLLPYTISKFALAGFTKGLRIELAKDNILVTGVYPSTMRSGGHTHALVKGDEQAEYTMFSLAGTLPLVSTSAEHVAQALWRGVCNGDAEVHVGWQTQLGTTIEALLPNWSAESFAMVTQLLPTASGPDQAIRGENIRGTLPELLTQQVPPSTRPGR